MAERLKAPIALPGPGFKSQQPHGDSTFICRGPSPLLWYTDSHVGKIAHRLKIIFFKRKESIDTKEPVGVF